MCVMEEWSYMKERVLAAWSPRTSGLVVLMITGSLIIVRTRPLSWLPWQTLSLMLALVSYFVICISFLIGLQLLFIEGKLILTEDT